MLWFASVRVYEHDGVDKIRVESAWQELHMQKFSHVSILAAMLDYRTYKESKGAS